MATNIVIESNTPEDFEAKMNMVNSANNVFATQTHVTVLLNGVLLYTAIFFIK